MDFSEQSLDEFSKKILRIFSEVFLKDSLKEIKEEFLEETF